MHLYLNNRSPLNSSFATDDGQVLYKVESELVSLGKRIANISRVVPNDVPRKEEDMRDRFAHLAKIEFNVLQSSIIHYGGNDIETKRYFRKEGWGAHGLKHRVFTAPDGREYKWLLGRYTPQLISNDGTKQVIAQFHRKNLGIIGKARPASLEISPAGEQLLETIFITFVYIEKIRKDGERGGG